MGIDQVIPGLPHPENSLDEEQKIQGDFTQRGADSYPSDQEQVGNSVDIQILEHHIRARWISDEID